MSKKPHWLFGITYLTQGVDLQINHLFWKGVPAGLLTDALNRPRQAIEIAATCIAIEWSGDTVEGMEQVEGYVRKYPNIDIEPYKGTVEEQVRAYWAKFASEHPDFDDELTL